MAKKPRQKLASPPSPVAPGDELLDMDQAIAALATTRPTFYRWLRDGRIKGMKLGRQWRFYRADVDRLLKGEQPRIDLIADIEPLISQLQGRLADLGGSVSANGTSDRVSVAIALMIAVASANSATDIHLMYLGTPNRAHLRLRIDGVLHEITTFDLRLLPPVVERMKSMASCDLAARGRPQDGWISSRIKERDIKLRAAFVPTLHGESVTLRLLESGFTPDLADMGFLPRDFSRIERALSLPWGLLVVNGPTGSGKTSTLYAMLDRRARPDIKIMTVEDPIEIERPGTVQTQVKPAAGATFPALLKYIARSDPDVVMVGELRDPESARLTLMLALTGHQVMTTLHTDDATSALVRLVDVTGESMIVGDAVKLVIAQRLVRRLCPKCAHDAAPDPALLAQVKEQARSGGLHEISSNRFRKPAGCKDCGFTGYRGRQVLAEILEVTPQVASAIKSRHDPRDIKRLAISQGMTTMLAHGLVLASEGTTALEEVLRVAPRD